MKIATLGNLEVHISSVRNVPFIEGDVVTGIPSFVDGQKFVVEKYQTWCSMDERYQRLELRQLRPDDSYDSAGQLVIITHNESDMKPRMPLSVTIIGRMKRVFVN